MRKDDFSTFAKWKVKDFHYQNLEKEKISSLPDLP